MGWRTGFRVALPSTSPDVFPVYRILMVDIHRLSVGWSEKMFGMPKVDFVLGGVQ